MKSSSETQEHQRAGVRWRALDEFSDAVVGRIRIRRDETAIAGAGPNAGFDDGDIGEAVALNVTAQIGCIFGIGLEAENFSRGCDQPRGEQRKEPKIRAEIIENHAGPQALRQRGLHGLLGFTVKIALPGPGVQFEPQACRGPIFHARPHFLIHGKNAVAHAMNQIADEGHVAQRAQTTPAYATADRPPIRARAAFYFSTTKLPMISASMPELKNVRMASVGELTMGSPRRLKDVFMTTGTPVRRPNSLMSRQ